MGYGWYLETFERVRWDAIFGGGLPGAEQKIRDALLWDEEGYLDGTDQRRPGWAREQVLASQEGRKAIALASHLARNGFTYSGLDPEQCERLDSFGHGVCAPELLGGDLDVRSHSPASLVGSQVGELLDRLGFDPSALLRRLELLRRRLEEPMEVQWVRARLRNLARMVAGRRPPTEAQADDTGYGSEAWAPHEWPRYLPLLVSGRRFGTEAHPPDPRHIYLHAIFSPAEVVELRNEVVAAIGAPAPWRAPEWEPEGIEECFLAPLTEVVKTGRWLHMRYT